MVIFNSYVKLPEGKLIKLPLANVYPYFGDNIPIFFG